MSWSGFALGAFLAQVFTGGRGGALASLLGGALGVAAESKFKKWSEQGKKQSYRRTNASSNTREHAFCACAAAMLAKMAKADGHVTADEIMSVERAFERLGFSSRTREYAINVFRKAKDDTHTIYDYAYGFASSVDSVEMRELLYRLLWELAAADGEISDDELALLRTLPKVLLINPHWFRVHSWDFCRAGGRDAGSRSRSGGRTGSGADSLSAAYRLLGVPSSAGDDEVKRAYREKAKRYHPDALRARGLPDSMIRQANEQMAKINAAWSQIRQRRGI